MAYLDAAEAAAFLRYRSASGVRNAVMRGELQPVGRGSRQCLLFTMEELERFVRARAARYGVARAAAPAQAEAPAVTAEAARRPARKARRDRRKEAAVSFRDIVARVKDRKAEAQRPRLTLVPLDGEEASRR